ncbi:sarcosine oxidase subunit alpha [Scopulibacillus darangshiensis]|uniref:Sarcosine oxidase subunit alpha n=1 Tax=Scopulibacillus darangshiensis TaxID=442528 RepID=A0A4R2NNU8_9BACL|nr:NAD(P)/FAD-dependent oxidoreductase [Scopulibacillus darangshiensis]TCP23453.1 sarcosine oxidase subunit alpha [Scopulibacillus darangshiensis]
MIDCLIVGAGPAGLSAAIACAENGLSTMVLDEFMKPGGRLLGQLHEEPNGIWWNGIDEAEKLYQRAKALSISFHLETSVCHLEKVDGKYWTLHTDKGKFSGKNLLIATGAAEQSLPIPGWTLPGVMSIGAAQVMANVHRVKPGHRGIVIGVNVLSAAIARELLLAGVNLEGIVLPPRYLLTKGQSEPKDVFQSLLHMVHLAPSHLMKIGGKMALKSSFIRKMAVGTYPKKGFKVWGMPIKLKQTVTEIIGKENVEGVKVASVDSSGNIIEGSEEILPVDFVCISGGLYPLAELVSLAGCPFKYIPSLGGHVPVHDHNMQTPVEGLYVAGNVTGIESAKVAMAQGHLAGLSISSQKNKVSDGEALQNARESVVSTRTNALIHFHPDILDGRRRLYG